MGMDLLHHRKGNSSEPLLEGPIINNLDLMLCQISTAQLSRLQRKEVYGIPLAKVKCAAAQFLADEPFQPRQVQLLKEWVFFST